MIRQLQIIFTLLIFAEPALAQTPNFDYPYWITNGVGYIIENNEYTCPAFGDWDDDGDADMMVGVLYEGNVLYYQNLSSGIPPVFNEAEIIMADGVPLSVAYA